jgi:hypothetical protein
MDLEAQIGYVLIAKLASTKTPAPIPRQAARA